MRNETEHLPAWKAKLKKASPAFLTRFRQDELLQLLEIIFIFVLCKSISIFLCLFPKTLPRNFIFVLNTWIKSQNKSNDSKWTNDLKTFYSKPPPLNVISTQIKRLLLMCGEKTKRDEWAKRREEKTCEAKYFDIA